jgi:hypothetical protein
MVFEFVTPRGLVGSVSEEHIASIFNGRIEDGSIFLRNVGINLQVHTALQLRRPT